MPFNDESQDVILTFLKEQFKDLKDTNSQEHKDILAKCATKDFTAQQQTKIDNHCQRIRSLETLNATLLTRDKFDILIKSNQGELANQREQIRAIDKKLVALEPVKEAYDKLAALAVGFLITAGLLVIGIAYYLREGKL